MAEMVDSETCKERRDAIGRSIDEIKVENQKAYKERLDLHKDLNAMRDGSEERVNAIMQKVSEGTTGGISMRLFLWTFGVAVFVLAGYAGWLLAMNVSIGKVETNTLLIQQEVKHSKEILRRVEDRIVNGRE